MINRNIVLFSLFLHTKDIIMETALFCGIKDYIIERLNEANSIIRIAVAWFTNDDLYQVILQLLDKGVQVELIIIDDHINRNEFGLDFKAFITKGGHLYLSTPTKNMHNKFFYVAIQIIGQYLLFINCLLLVT